jgi:hypothetical protein
MLAAASGGPARQLFPHSSAIVMPSLPYVHVYVLLLLGVKAWAWVAHAAAAGQRLGRCAQSKQSRHGRGTEL